MIGFLRFIGVINAAVWLGGVVFFTISAGPFFSSADAEALLGEANAPFFSRAMGLLLAARWFHFNLVCAIIAWLHLLAEWLYLGRPQRRKSFTLLAGLLGIVLLFGAWLLPVMRQSHEIRFSPNSLPAERAKAVTAFRIANTVSGILHVLLIGALVVYVWRTAHPSDSPRFITSVKFRG